jgi:hypothetical protein
LPAKIVQNKTVAFIFFPFYIESMKKAAFRVIISEVSSLRWRKQANFPVTVHVTDYDSFLSGSS